MKIFLFVKHVHDFDKPSKSFSVVEKAYHTRTEAVEQLRYHTDSDDECTITHYFVQEIDPEDANFTTDKEEFSDRWSWYIR